MSAWTVGRASRCTRSPRSSTRTTCRPSGRTTRRSTPSSSTTTSAGPDDRERPPLALAEPPEGDVGVLGGEVRAVQAPGPGGPVRLLQRILDLLAVLRVEEQLALDVHPGDVRQVQAELVLGDLDVQPV